MIDFNELNQRGLDLLGNPSGATHTPIRSTFYGTSIRIQTEKPLLDVHIKSNPAHFANEAMILNHFHDVGLAHRFPQMVAHSVDGTILATRSCGFPMRELFKSKERPLAHSAMLNHLADALLALVETQSKALPSSLLAAGCPRFSTAELPELIDNFHTDGLEDSAITPEQRKALKHHAKQWMIDAHALASLEIPDTWDHGDFGSGNVLLSTDEPARAVIIDLSESSIMNPCFSSSQFIWRLSGHLGIDPKGADAERLRQFWADAASKLLGPSHEAFLAALDLCSKLHIPYSLLVSKRFARAHRSHFETLFPNPALTGMI